MNGEVNRYAQSTGRDVGMATVPVTIWNEVSERWRIAKENLEQANVNLQEASERQAKMAADEQAAWDNLYEHSGRAPRAAQSMPSGPPNVAGLIRR